MRELPLSMIKPKRRSASSPVRCAFRFPGPISSLKTLKAICMLPSTWWLRKSSNKSASGAANIRRANIKSPPGPSGLARRKRFDLLRVTAGMILRGRLVLPVSGPPIQDGAIVLSGRRIKAIGRWRDLGGSTRGKKLDLGEVLLMPGLVNAHCHLDYTNMAGEFPPPKVFIDWLKVITTAKAGWSFSDYA